MQQISYPLQCGQAITLQGDFGGTAADFSVLARLTCTDLLENEVSDAHVIGETPGILPPENSCSGYRTASIKSIYDSADQCFRIYLRNGQRLNEHLYRIFIWQMSTICGALAALLRGTQVQLMHCSMLERNNRAILLLGESGIGKSTTMRRWIAAGGEAEADDMVLLEYIDNGDILVHRLPTWSACRERLEGRCYRFNPPLKLEKILAISRGDDFETVNYIPKADFYAQIYRCGFFHYLDIARTMPFTEQQLFAGRIRQLTDRLTAQFPPQALFAHLDGDINKTLEEWL